MWFLPHTWKFRLSVVILTHLDHFPFYFGDWCKNHFGKWETFLASGKIILGGAKIILASGKIILFSQLLIIIVINNYVSHPLKTIESK